MATAFRRGRSTPRSAASPTIPRSSGTTAASRCSATISRASPRATSLREWSRGARRSSSDTPRRSRRSSGASACPDPFWWRSGARRRVSAATTARFPPISALATLAWDCRRAERFRAELVDALMLVERGIVAQPHALRGAWAGEIGQTQLMPSAYLMYATTPDGSGTPDLIHIPPTRSHRPLLSSKGMAGSPGRAGTKASPTSPPSCNGIRRRFTQRQSRCSPTGWRGEARTRWRDAQVGSSWRGGEYAASCARGQRMSAESDLALRVRAALHGVEAVREVKMFGGVGFMVNGNLVAAASKRGLSAARQGASGRSAGSAWDPADGDARSPHGGLCLRRSAAARGSIKAWLRWRWIMSDLAAEAGRREPRRRRTCRRVSLNRRRLSSRACPRLTKPRRAIATDRRPGARLRRRVALAAAAGFFTHERARAPAILASASRVSPALRRLRWPSRWTMRRCPG